MAGEAGGEFVMAVDEFVVVGRGNEFIGKFITDLQANIDELNRVSGKPYPLSASVGHITRTPMHKDQLFELIQLADLKMYENKKIFEI